MRSNRRGTKLGDKPGAKKEEKQTPFPAMIDGNKWQIREGKIPAFVAKTDEGEFLMQVPMGNNEADRRIRLHEEGHVAFTPLFSSKNELPSGVEWDTLNAVEDSRVAIKLAKVADEYRHLNENVPVLSRQMRQKFEAAFRATQEAMDNPGAIDLANPPMNPLDLARFVAASKGYEEESFFRNQASYCGFDWINETVDELYDQHFSKANPEWEDTVNYARSLEEKVGQMMQALADEQGELKDGQLEENQNRSNYRHKSAVKVEWGKMELKRPPLPERMPVGMKSYKNRANDRGQIPVNWHRYCTDMKLFNRRRKKNNESGTILVDQSGSMSLSTDELIEILARWPGVIVAGYSGHGGVGYLRILAEKGKRVHDRDLPARVGGNIVDGPALDWLCKQPGPRVWISDGLVTGAYENTDRNLLLDAARKVKKGRIIRVENVREILGDA